MGLYTIEFLEDVNLSGGTADTALGLAAGRRGPWTNVSGSTDLARGNLSKGQKVVGAIIAGETVSQGGGSWTCAENPRSPYSLGSISSDSLDPARMWGINVPIPPGATLGGNGLQGAGAEQSAVVLYISDPAYPDPWNWSGGNNWDEVIVVQPTTAARVANTISGHTDICGRNVAYTGAQTAIPSDPSTIIQVLGVVSNDVAGYSGACLVSPGKANLMMPTAATHPTYYDMMSMFGAYPTCNAASPFEIAGVGVTTAAMTLSQLTLGINWGKR